MQENSPAIPGFSNHTPCYAKTEWAVQDENTPPLSSEKSSMGNTGAVKSAADKVPIGFVAAVAAIVALPLTDSEKAEAIRRLIAERVSSDKPTDSENAAVVCVQTCPPSGSL